MHMCAELYYLGRANVFSNVATDLGPSTKSQRDQRTTCIEAHNWPSTKLILIVMNNSCVVPLIETDMEIGDRPVEKK